MTNGQKVYHLQNESRAEKAKGNFERSIKCIQELLELLKEDKVSLRIAALEWHRMAGMYIRLGKPKEAEIAARNALENYLRNRALFDGAWHRNHDGTIAEYAMTLSRCLVDQQRYEEALPWLEESAAIYMLKGKDDPFVKELVIPRLNWLRPRAEAQRTARTSTSPEKKMPGIL